MFIALINPCSQPYEWESNWLSVDVLHNGNHQIFISVGKRGMGYAVGYPYILCALISSKITLGHLYRSISWGS